MNSRHGEDLPKKMQSARRDTGQRRVKSGWEGAESQKDPGRTQQCEYSSSPSPQ